MLLRSKHAREPPGELGIGCFEVRESRVGTNFNRAADEKARHANGTGREDRPELPAKQAALQTECDSHMTLPTSV